MPELKYNLHLKIFDNILYYDIAKTNWFLKLRIIMCMIKHENIYYILFKMKVYIECYRK